jgi:hypothetical protein
MVVVALNGRSTVERGDVPVDQFGDPPGLPKLAAGD